MAYIGNNSTVQQLAPQIAYFSGNGSTTVFTLPASVVSSAQILVFVANVPQNPSGAYTVNGTTLTFTSAPPTGTNNIWVEYNSLQTNTVVPAYGTVGPSQINSAYSLWNSSGSTINYTAGNVGIGTASPTAKLHLYNPSVSTALTLQQASTYSYLLNDATNFTIGSHIGTTGIKAKFSLSAPDNSMVLDSSGYLTTPNIPFFTASGTTNGTIAAGSVAPFSSCAVNSGNFNTSTYQFTAPVAGKYMFGLSIYVFSTQNASFCFVVNGTQWTAGVYASGVDVTIAKTSSGVAGDTTIALSAPISLAANDTVQVNARVGVGASYAYMPHSIFSGYLIG